MWASETLFIDRAIPSSVVAHVDIGTEETIFSSFLSKLLSPLYAKNMYVFSFQSYHFLFVLKMMQRVIHSIRITVRLDESVVVK